MALKATKPTKIYILSIYICRIYCYAIEQHLLINLNGKRKLYPIFSRTTCQGESLQLQHHLSYLSPSFAPFKWRRFIQCPSCFFNVSGFLVSFPFLLNGETLSRAAAAHALCCSCADLQLFGQRLPMIFTTSCYFARQYYFIPRLHLYFQYSKLSCRSLTGSKPCVYNMKFYAYGHVSDYQWRK